MEVQHQDGGQSDELVGEVASRGVVGPPIRDGGRRVGQAVDAGDNVGVVGAHRGRGAGGGHRLLDGGVEHLLFGLGVRDQVPAQKVDDLAQDVGGLVGIPAVNLGGDGLWPLQVRQQSAVFGPQRLGGKGGIGRARSLGCGFGVGVAVSRLWPRCGCLQTDSLDGPFTINAMLFQIHTQPAPSHMCETCGGPSELAFHRLVPFDGNEQQVRLVSPSIPRCTDPGCQSRLPRHHR